LDSDGELVRAALIELRK